MIDTSVVVHSTSVKTIILWLITIYNKSTNIHKNPRTLKSILWNPYKDPIQKVNFLILPVQKKLQTWSTKALSSFSQKKSSVIAGKPWNCWLHKHLNQLIKRWIFKTGEFFCPQPPYSSIPLKQMRIGKCYNNPKCKNWGKSVFLC